MVGAARPDLPATTRAQRQVSICVHGVHTYWIGNLRLVLDAQLEPGDRHSPVHSRPGLMALLEELPQAQRPKLVRGDCAFGSEGEMSALESIGQPYLFKLR